MKLFEDSIKERLEGFVEEVKHFRSELILIIFSIVLIIISISVFVRADQKRVQANAIEIENGDESVLGQKTKTVKSIFIDISGAVQKPDVYELPEDSRLRDGLVAAGGLSENANRDYFAQNYNLARRLEDGEKIYIPNISDKTLVIGTGSNNAGSIASQTTQTGSTGNKININNATSSELDRLSGVGPVTADKIIDGRPYNSIDELLSKKAVSKSIFEKIKDLVTIQ